MRGAAVSKLPTYVLITPARNEARFIEQTIQAVVAQTVLPLKWVIVSDGSTDATDDIVRRYANAHEWIELVRLPERRERHFAGKVYAFNAGQAAIGEPSYDVIANLDADITFASDYFDFLLEKLAADPKLGVVGTPYVETTNETYDYHFVNIEHVSGACQVFRRACYEAIGGYVPVKVGTIDCIAVITARMKGWKTRTFTEKVCTHHRQVGTAESGQIKSRFVTGAMDYTMGNHPVWQIFRSFYQMTQRPYLIRGLAIAAGYAGAWLRQAERPVSKEFVAFHRHEQMQRLREAWRRRMTRGATANPRRPAVSEAAKKSPALDEGTE